LKVGAIAETITVAANASQVETRSTGVGLVVGQEQIVGLPLNGRQATSLVAMAGGAVDTSNVGGLTSNRQPPNAVAISVGGGTGTDDGVKRNQAGGTIGGRVIKDRMFFFGGLQLTNQTISPQTTNQIVPTRDVLRGDFGKVMSAACRGGTAQQLGLPFVNNQVDPSLFSPFALK